MNVRIWYLFWMSTLSIITQTQQALVWGVWCRCFSRAVRTLVVIEPDSWSKGCEFESWQERREIFFFFFSRVNFMCWLFFDACSTPVLPQWHLKVPGHSAKSAGVRIDLNTHTPLNKQSRSGLTMPLSRHNVKTYPETSSHANRLSSMSHCVLILA